MLSERQVEQFNNDGYLILKNMVAPAVRDRMLSVTQQDLRGAVPPLEYETDVGYPGAPQSFDAPGGRTARRLRGAYDRDACFQQWSRDAGLVAMLAQLFGEPVCLSLAHHNCIKIGRAHV